MEGILQQKLQQHKITMFTRRSKIVHACLYISHSNSHVESFKIENKCFFYELKSQKQHVTARNAAGRKVTVWNETYSFPEDKLG